MGLDFELSVPETQAEFDKLAGKDGACLNEAILNVVYRSTLPDVRDRFISELETASGESFPQVTVKVEGKDTLIDDPKTSDGAFVKAVRAKKGWTEPTAWSAAATPILLRALAGNPKAVDTDGKPDEEARKPIAFDPKATERKPRKPAKLPADYLATATKVFANNNQHKMVDRIKKESDGTVVVEYTKEPAKGHPDHDKTRAANIEALGWGLKRNIAYLNKKQQESYA